MATDNAYGTCLKFWKSLNQVTTIPNKNSTTKETLGTGNNSKDTFWASNEGIIENTYTLYAGTSTLTETTHYTLDLDTGKVTLTASGITELGTNILYIEYSYNNLGIPNSETLRLLNWAESYVITRTEMKFAEYTDDDPAYRKVSNETFEGRFDARWKTFDAFWPCIVKLTTTVNGAYTTGGTTLTLSDGTGFPNAGTIYIGGNKVSYTAKSGNDLTVPSTTSSIADGADVFGEVIEVSKESEGSEPSYEVLERDVDYKIDFLHGRIELLGNAYFGEFQNTSRFYPSNYIIRATYFSAWHDAETNPTVPDDIEQCIYMLATNRMIKSTVGKAMVNGLNGFNPTMVTVDRTDIDNIIAQYKPLNVGTSPFNKAHIS